MICPVIVQGSETVRVADGGSLSVRQWDVIDLRFRGDEAQVRELANPVDVDLVATFQDEAGTRLSVDGFYNDGCEYIVRFTPPSSGQWSYETESSMSSLDGKTGTLVVESPQVGRRGGIVVDAKEKTRFQYESGDSYYPIAFECDWLFALDAGNESDIPVTRQFVDTLAENGFNQVVMNVFAYDVNWKKDERLTADHDYGSPSVFPFGGTNEDPDFSRLNIDYFKRLDRVIEYLDQKDIVAHLMIYVWNKRVNWPEADSEADNRYFDYVARRYQAYPNLVWDISKEALGYGHNDVGYISQRIERLREHDAYDRLVTVHDYSYCRRFVDKVDFVSVQLWSSELYGVMRKVRSDMPGKPILNIEHGGYERGPYVVFNGNYTSPEVCLERSYQCVFAGTYTTHYWQGAAWNAIIADIESLPAKVRPRLDYYRHMRTLADRFQFDQLIAGDKKSNAGFCLHDGKGKLIYYVPRECDFLGLRLKEFQGRTMSITWFNPRSGEYTESESQKIAQWPAVEVPSSDGFQVLIVQIQ
ncbi:DUF5060 domain-containing protein [Neorhodopirellula lusitana]|nr:DUF5060 domain-containing protein [Neorhodopirellula lusitana]